MRKWSATSIETLVKLARTGLIVYEMFEKIEKKISKNIICEKLNPEKAYKKYWEPLSIAFYERIKSDKTEVGLVLKLIDGIIEEEESYNTTNFLMEFLLYAVKNKWEMVDFPKYRAATVFYNPLHSSIKGLEEKDMIRFYRDLNIEIEEKFSGDSNSNSNSKSDKKFGVVQLIPGLGCLKPDKEFYLCDEEGLLNFLNKRLNQNKSSNTLSSIAADFGIRIAVINLQYNLSSNRSLIKYNFNAVRSSIESRGKIITADVIRKTNPFIIPIDKLDDKLVNGEIYKIYGTSGDILVVLDYGWGEERYQPLTLSGEEIFITKEIENLDEFIVRVGFKNINIIRHLQSQRMISKYLFPSIFKEVTPIVKLDFPKRPKAVFLGEEVNNLKDYFENLEKSILTWENEITNGKIHPLLAIKRNLLLRRLPSIREEKIEMEVFSFLQECRKMIVLFENEGR